MQSKGIIASIIIMMETVFDVSLARMGQLLAKIIIAQMIRFFANVINDVVSPVTFVMKDHLI